MRISDWSSDVCSSDLFAAPLIAGEIIGNSMGIGFASMIDPQTGRSSAALSNFLSTMLTLLFLSVNGHLILVDMLVKRYDAMRPEERLVGKECVSTFYSRCSPYLSIKNSLHFFL